MTQHRHSWIWKSPWWMKPALRWCRCEVVQVQMESNRWRTVQTS